MQHNPPGSIWHQVQTPRHNPGKKQQSRREFLSNKIRKHGHLSSRMGKRRCRSLNILDTSKEGTSKSAKINSWRNAKARDVIQPTPCTTSNTPISACDATDHNYARTARNASSSAKDNNATTPTESGWETSQSSQDSQEKESTSKK